MADRFIAVAGNIGVGKSSLVGFLHAQWGLEPFYEPFSDNPYLDDFYGDMKRWSFHSQMWFLAHKYRLHRELESRRAPWCRTARSTRTPRSSPATSTAPA